MFVGEGDVGDSTLVHTGSSSATSRGKMSTGWAMRVDVCETALPIPVLLGIPLALSKWPPLAP